MLIFEEFNTCYFIEIAEITLDMLRIPKFSYSSVFSVSLLQLLSSEKTDSIVYSFLLAPSYVC